MSDREPPADQIIREPGNYATYQAKASENNIYEWATGEVYQMPPPTTEHQNIVTFFCTLLKLYADYFSLGKVLTAPFEVKLWPDGPARQPDGIFIANGQMSQLGSQRFNGAPAILLEVLSPGSVRHDRVQKFAEYEKAGVLEYWMIDSRAYRDHHTIDCFFLNDDQELEDQPLTEDHLLYSKVLNGFWIDPDWLQTRINFSSQVAFAKMMLSKEDLAPEEKAYFKFLIDKQTK